MSSAEWEMVIYAGVIIGVVALGVRFAGLDRLHRLFFCVFFPVAIQLVLFAIAYQLATEKGWLSFAVIGIALVTVAITIIKTFDLAFKQVEQDTFSLAIGSMFRAAFIPLVITLLAIITY